MKLLKQSNGSRRYRLNQNEAHVLSNLLKRFPFSKTDCVTISRTDKGLEAEEREKMLNESLAQQRKELKKLAVNLIRKFQKLEKGYLLTLNPEEHEILLQILNDIRIGSWRVLGEPEDLDPEPPPHTEKELVFYNLMNLAGYFESVLLRLTGLV